MTGRARLRRVMTQQRRQADNLANPYTFTGRRFDEETGIYQFRYRYYHAQLGRFVSRDPLV